MICPNCKTENPLLGINARLPALTIKALMDRDESGHIKLTDVPIVKYITLWCHTCSHHLYFKEDGTLGDQFEKTKAECDMAARHNYLGNWHRQKETLKKHKDGSLEAVVSALDPDTIAKLMATLSKDK